jgi:hypothetical protein
MARRTRNSKGRFVKKSKARKSRRRRRNGAGLGRAGFAAARAAAAPAKRRKSRRKGRKAAKRSGRRIRPTILVSKTGAYRRPRRSKYFKRPRMVNGRKRRRLSRRRNGGSLMSIVKRTLTVSTLSGYLSIGGGIFAGAMLSRMLNTGVVPFTETALPASVSETLGSKYVRPFHGILHIVLGGLIASKVKNKYVRDAGMGLAALGGYDLLSQALSALGVANLPSLSGMNVNMLGRTSYSGMNVDLLGGGMNVDLMGDSRSSDAESGYLADNINDMIS